MTAATAAGASVDARLAPRGAVQGYRADIDGLRAVAVVPVVLFHAGVRGFSGGFIGVDIFFVISGYLITSILAREVATGSYSVIGFYRRRVLRLLPALAVMVVATTLGTAALALAPEAGGYARSLAATALFASNIHFFWQTDYFNHGVTLQPLLHTWSLAVEEQWYILWPLLIALAGATGRGALLWVTALVTLASLALAILLLPSAAAATFYLLPGRAWELGLGAVLALAPRVTFAQRVETLIAGAALLTIAACVKLYTKDTPFPGLAAVPPCVAALLLLRPAAAATPVGRALALPPLRAIGLVSYSLYLWHWPAILLVRDQLLIGGGRGIVLTLTLAGGAAWLSYRLVERPFRGPRARAWSTPQVLAGGLATIGLMLALAALTPALNRLIHPADRQEDALAGYLNYDGDAGFRRDQCFRVGARSRFDAASCLDADPGKPAILILGDSLAAQLWPGLARHRDRLSILQATITACAAALPRPGDRYCTSVIGAGLDRAARPRRPIATLIAGRWTPATVDQVAATLRDPRLRGANPVLIGPMPEYEVALPRLLVMARRTGDPDLPQRMRQPSTALVDARLRAIAAQTGTRYISLISLFCRAGRCRTFAAPGVPMQFDAVHLTPAGSALVADAIIARVLAPEAQRLGAR